MMWYIVMSCAWQLLKGTHRCGRIEHSLVHGQTVADSERVQQLSKHFEHLYADLYPGEELLSLWSRETISLCIHLLTILKVMLFLLVDLRVKLYSVWYE